MKENKKGHTSLEMWHLALWHLAHGSRIQLDRASRIERRRLRASAARYAPLHRTRILSTNVRDSNPWTFPFPRCEGASCMWAMGRFYHSFTNRPGSGNDCAWSVWQGSALHLYRRSTIERSPVCSTIISYRHLVVLQSAHRLSCALDALTAPHAVLLFYRIFSV